MNNILHESADFVKSIPYKSTAHFDNMEQRLFQYTETKNKLLVYYAQQNIVIPEFDEAQQL